MKRKHSILLFVTASVLLLFAHFADASEVLEPVDDLNGTHWWVEDIEGKGVVDSSHTTISFFEEGRVAGDSGCNRYTGGVEIEGAGISFGMMAGTRRACAEALMNQETAFYGAISRVVSWEVAETGLLHLKDEAGDTLIRAWRTEAEQ